MSRSIFYYILCLISTFSNIPVKSSVSCGDRDLISTFTGNGQGWTPSGVLGYDSLPQKKKFRDDIGIRPRNNLKPKFTIGTTEIFPLWSRSSSVSSLIDPPSNEIISAMTLETYFYSRRDENLLQNLLFEFHLFAFSFVGFTIRAATICSAAFVVWRGITFTATVLTFASSWRIVIVVLKTCWLTKR